MINLTVVGTAVLAGVTLLIGMSVLIYQHYRFRRKSIDWGDLERYDTPLEALPRGSNNSSFRSYKYSHLVGKLEGQPQRTKQQRRKFESAGNIERHRQTRGSRSSTKSCPPGVFTFPPQEFTVSEEQQWVQPYYYYRQIVVDPSVCTKTRLSLPEVVSNITRINRALKENPNYRSSFSSSNNNLNKGNNYNNYNYKTVDFNLEEVRSLRKSRKFLGPEEFETVGSETEKVYGANYNSRSDLKIQEMLTHQARSMPSGPPIPGARLNRTYSISSQGQIDNAVRKGHRGSSPAIRTYNPEGYSFDVSTPPDSPPLIYTGSRSPSPLHIRAASLDTHRSGSPCPDLRGSSSHVEVTHHSSHSMDAYPTGKAPMLSPNSLCVRRASRCLSPLFIPPCPKSPDGGSVSSCSQPSSTGPLSPLLGSLNLDLYLKKDVTIFLDACQRITNLSDETKKPGENGTLVNSSYSIGGRSNGHSSLGRLHFRLKYDMDKSDLHLHVIEAHDLARGDQGGFNDPYIRVFLSPEVDSRKRETSIHRNESNPFYDEQFKFPVSQEDLEEKTLLLQVLDFDRYSRNDVVGEVSFGLDEFDITTNLEVWAEIVQNKKPSGEKQEILISLSYLPSAERLTVVLLKARNLHPPHNKDTIDPFVKVYLLGGGRRQKKKKTTARKNSNNPVWNEAFTFSIPSEKLASATIEISVLDQSNDLMGSNALIGSCMLGPHQKGSELSHWQEMSHNLRQTITTWHVLT